MNDRRTKFPYAQIAVAMVAVGLLALSQVRVATRITAIKMSAIYTNLSASHPQQDVRGVLTAGEYPSRDRSAYYYWRTADGSVRLHCFYDDLNHYMPSRRKWDKGATSMPLGDVAFFKNESSVEHLLELASSEHLLELAYRRHNLNVNFRFSPARKSAFDMKQRLEQAAKVLDDAIAEGNANIVTEDVRLYQVVGYRVRYAVEYGLFSLYFTLFPNASM